MSFKKAKKAFEENGRRYLSNKDGHVWNTNAGLLNLAQGTDDAISDIEARLARIEQLLQQIAHNQRR